MRHEGHAFVFGDDIDTDQIVPGRYLELVTPEDIAVHAMEGCDPTFARRFQRGSVLIAGKNFGCGSSREHAPIGLKAIGVGCVVAESFARIFYRNAINVGLPVLRCPGVTAAVREGDEVEVDLAEGTVRCSGGKVLQGEKLSTDLMNLVSSGGLIPFVRAKLKGGKS